MEHSPLKVIKIFRRGEPTLPITQPNGRKISRSGVNIEVSPAGFDDYEQQFKDASLFLLRNATEITRLRRFDGVESICIDFGANIYPPGFSSFVFPYQLLQMAGSLEVDLELSVYPTEPEHETDGDAERAKLDEAYDEFIADTKPETEEQASDGNPPTMER